MAIILKDKVNPEIIYDIVSLKEIEPKKIPVIVKEFEKDYTVIRKEREV